VHPGCGRRFPFACDLSLRRTRSRVTAFITALQQHSACSATECPSSHATEIGHGGITAQGTRAVHEMTFSMHAVVEWR
jgi:hypothetical protein